MNTVTLFPNRHFEPLPPHNVDMWEFDIENDRILNLPRANPCCGHSCTKKREVRVGRALQE